MREAVRGFRQRNVVLLQASEELQRARLVLFEAIGHYNLHGLVSYPAVGECAQNPQLSSDEGNRGHGSRSL